MHDAKILILDEPSSALDPVSEFNMYTAMMNASHGKTVFYISHRVSTARLADKIIYLENREIAEYGTHDEMLKLNGKYAAMFWMQVKNYIEEELYDC